MEKLNKVWRERRNENFVLGGSTDQNRADLCRIMRFNDLLKFNSPPENLCAKKATRKVPKKSPSSYLRDEIQFLFQAKLIACDLMWNYKT